MINTKTPVQHLFTAIEQGNHTAINRLLNELSIKNNLDTKYPEYNHHTFLGYAISQDKYEIAYSLLYKGATINTRSGIKLETPLQLALTRKRAATLIASLLSYTDTLNINATNYLNQNALHYAVFFKQNKFIPLLIKKGINIHHHDISGATALTLARGESLLYGQFVHNQEAIDILEAHGANRDFLLAAVAALEKID